MVVCSIVTTTWPISQPAPSLTQLVSWAKMPLPTPFRALVIGAVIAPVIAPLTLSQASPTGLPPPIAPPVSAPSPPVIAWAGAVAISQPMSARAGGGEGWARTTRRRQQGRPAPSATMHSTAPAHSY